MHNLKDKRTHTIMPENKNEDWSDGISQLKKDALNTTKAKDIDLTKKKVID